MRADGANRKELTGQPERTGRDPVLGPSACHIGSVIGFPEGQAGKEQHGGYVRSSYLPTTSCIWLFSCSTNNYLLSGPLCVFLTLQTPRQSPWPDSMTKTLTIRSFVLLRPRPALWHPVLLLLQCHGGPQCFEWVSDALKSFCAHCTELLGTKPYSIKKNIVFAMPHHLR